MFTEHTTCVFVFSTNLYEIFQILRSIQRGIIVGVHRPSCKVPVILYRRQWNSNFVDSFSKKWSNTEINENPSSGSRVVACGQTDRETDGQTDRQTETERRVGRQTFLQWCNSP